MLVIEIIKNWSNFDAKSSLGDRSEDDATCDTRLRNTKEELGRLREKIKEDQRKREKE